MDTRTLIFCIALLNLSFALLVWTYSRTLRTAKSPIKLWQMAKLVCFVGYLIGWMRPLLPDVLLPWAHIGNSMQFLGIGMELMAYCGLLGLQHRHRPIGVAMAVGLLVYVLTIMLDDSSHSRILSSTGVAGLFYATMALTLWQHQQKSPLLMRLMASFDGLLALLLLGKVAIGVLAVTMVPYANSLINTLLYVTAFVVISNNGFGFLLLIKKEDDQRLSSVLEELNQANAQQRHFIAMLSHEVRAPLSVVDTSLQLLTLKAAQQSDYQQLLDRMARGTERLKDFFDDCLTQDRLSSPNFTGQPEPVDMTELLQLKKGKLEQLAPHHQLHFELPQGEFYVRGDAALLRILVTNLLNNAIKFSPAGSTITLRLTLVDGTPVPMCRLTVSDQGPGIADDEAELIFQKYKRGRNAYRTPGAGLGLAVVKRIAQLHGGTVSVHNKSTGGACFVVDIPCAGGMV